MKPAELEAVMKASPRGMWDLKNSENVPAQVESETNKNSGLHDSPEEVKRSMVVDGIPNSIEGETRGSCVPSDEIVLVESMRNLHTVDDNQNDYAAPRAIPSSKLESFENDTDLYTDKKIVDLEMPELMAFYDDNDNNVVKDICIDEGVPCTEKISMGSEQENIISTKDANQFVSNAMPKAPLDNDYDEVGTDEVVENGGFISDDGSESSSEDFDYNNIGDNGQPLAPAETGQATHDSTEKIVDDDASEEEPVEENAPSTFQGIGIRSSLKSLLDSLDCNGEEVQKQNVKIASSEAECETPYLVPTIEEESTKTNPESSFLYDSKVETATITFDFKSSKAEASGTTCQSPDDDNNEKQSPDSTEGPPKPDEDYFPENFGNSIDARHSLGESSFSMAGGPVSGLITYSGQIAYSGSVSLRSDSSTTSTRSFAFPVLANEWNTSPIRMAKAGRRHYRRHRGWRHGLLCCRF